MFYEVFSLTVCCITNVLGCILLAIGGYRKHVAKRYESESFINFTGKEVKERQAEANRYRDEVNHLEDILAKKEAEIEAIQDWISAHRAGGGQ